MESKTLPKGICVAFFPTLQSLSGNPYWSMLVEELEKSGVPLYTDTPPAFDLAWLIKNRQKIKILHIHYFQQFYKSSTTFNKCIKLLIFIFNMVLAQVMGYRTVLTLHNLEGTYLVQPKWLDHIGHWVAVNFSERVIVHCNEAKRLMAEMYGRRRDVYVVDHPNFIDHYQNLITRKESRRQLILPENAFVFAFFGAVRPNKGIETLIRAFQKLHNEEFQLLIAGKVFFPEEYAKSLQDLASDDKRISFYFNHIPDEEIQLYFNAADIIVLPFTKILTSSSANLAMSFGRPVIAPNIGCLPELIGLDFGWVFEAGDIDSLANAMELAVKSDVDQVGKKAFEKISQFSPSHFAEQTLKVYED